MTVRRIPATLIAWFAAALLAAATPAQADDLQEATRLFRQGQHTHALERVDKYLAQRPRDAQGRFLKGLILAEQGRTADAIQVFAALTQDYPELPEPYNNLAVLYASQGQYEKARQALERAIQTHPSYATAHENLGDIYAKMASQAYDKALQLDRSNSAAETKLALVGELFSGKGAAPAAKAEPARRVATAQEQQQLAKAQPVPPPAQAGKAAPPAPPKPAPAANAAPAVAPAPPAVVPAPQPAAPSQPAAPAPQPAANPPKADPGRDREALVAAVNAWAAAWSEQNVSRYLAAYAKDFRTPGGEPRSEWEDTRRERVTKPKTISVTVKGPEIEFVDADRARVVFRQEYRSDTLKSNAVKSLTMMRSGGKWLIQEEKVGR